jgi:hypothetical protein
MLYPNALYNPMLTWLPAAGWSADSCCFYLCHQPTWPYHNHKAMPQAIKHKVLINHRLHSCLYQQHHGHWLQRRRSDHPFQKQNHYTPCYVGRVDAYLNHQWHRPRCVSWLASRSGDAWHTRSPTVPPASCTSSSWQRGLCPASLEATEVIQTRG